MLSNMLFKKYKLRLSWCISILRLIIISVSQKLDLCFNFLITLFYLGPELTKCICKMLFFFGLFFKPPAIPSGHLKGSRGRFLFNEASKVKSDAWLGLSEIINRPCGNLYKRQVGHRF